MKEVLTTFWWCLIQVKLFSFKIISIMLLIMQIRWQSRCFSSWGIQEGLIYKGRVGWASVQPGNANEPGQEEGWLLWNCAVQHTGATNHMKLFKFRSIRKK